MCWSTNKWRVNHTCSCMLRNWLIAPRDIYHYIKNTSIICKNIACYCNILSVSVFCLNFLFCLAFFLREFCESVCGCKQLLNSSSHPHTPPVKDLSQHFAGVIPILAFSVLYYSIYIRCVSAPTAGTNIFSNVHILANRALNCECMFTAVSP